jgi:ribonuclease BN (tRNA processing enzyme)
MRVLPLGTNGFFPSFNRQTMSFLVLDDRRPLLLDAGSGVGRLVEPSVAKELEGHEHLDVVLTHYHLDHLTGLPSLGFAWRRPIDIWLPMTPLVDARPGQALDRIFGPPLFPIKLEDYPIPVTVHTYHEDFEVAGRKVRVRRQQHSGGSVGLRIDDCLAYCTDTAAEEGTIELARGVDLLLHELWVDDEQAARHPRLVEGHASCSQVADIAERAGVRALAPIHHHPQRDTASLAVLHRQLANATTMPNISLIEGVPYSV